MRCQVVVSLGKITGRMRPTIGAGNLENLHKKEQSA